MQVVVEMPEFERCAKRLGVTEEERTGIVDFIAANPEAGDEISGTGGARKIRFASQKKGKGKSGGYRVITFFSGAEIPVFLLSIYAKGQKDTLTAKEKNALRTVLNLLADAYKERKKQ